MNHLHMVVRKIQWLRRKYELNPSRSSMETLDRLAWFSLPCVYGSSEVSSACKEVLEIKRQKRRHYVFIKRLLCNYSHCFFATFTINDEYLSSVSFQTFKRYLKAYMNDSNFAYFANADFGKKTNRLHFHAVIASNGSLPSSWKYGFCKFKPIKNRSDPDAHRLRSYLNKLTNHATKDGALKPFHSRCDGALELAGLENVVELPILPDPYT